MPQGRHLGTVGQHLAPLTGGKAEQGAQFKEGAELAVALRPAALRVYRANEGDP